jgi:hypothetical protein
MTPFASKTSAKGSSAKKREAERLDVEVPGAVGMGSSGEGDDPGGAQHGSSSRAARSTSAPRTVKPAARDAARVTPQEQPPTKPLTPCAADGACGIAMDEGLVTRDGLALVHREMSIEYE